MAIVDAGLRKDLDLQVVSPVEQFGPLPEKSIWPSIYRLLARKFASIVPPSFSPTTAAASNGSPPYAMQTGVRSIGVRDQESNAAAHAGPPTPDTCLLTLTLLAARTTAALLWKCASKRSRL